VPTVRPRERTNTKRKTIFWTTFDASYFSICPEWQSASTTALWRVSGVFSSGRDIKHLFNLTTRHGSLTTYNVRLCFNGTDVFYIRIWNRYNQATLQICKQKRIDSFLISGTDYITQVTILTGQPCASRCQLCSFFRPLHFTHTVHGKIPHDTQIELLPVKWTVK